MSLRTGNALPIAGDLAAASAQSRTAAARAPLVKFLVVGVFLLCMTAPENLLAPVDLDALNPFAGPVKLVLLGLGCGLLYLCRSRRYLKVLAIPFAWLMAWALLCWFFTGADMLPLRNLVSSFGGILVLAGLCGAAEIVGVRGMVSLLLRALALALTLSVLFGLAGIQAMPGVLAMPGQLELFHGVGAVGYMDAACVCLIAWVLAWHLANPAARIVAPLLLLLAVPALSFLRAFLIGAVASIMAAALFDWWRHRRPGNLQGRGGSRSKALLLVVALTLCVGAAIVFLKTSSREEGSELSGREIIWPIEIAAIAQHPLLGLGPFGDIQMLFFDERLPQVGAAHSDYLGAAVCYGLPGLFLFVATLVGLTKRVLRYRGLTRDERACRDAALFSLVALSTTMIAENVIRDPRLFCLYLLFPALCLAAECRQRQEAAAR